MPNRCRVLIVSSAECCYLLPPAGGSLSLLWAVAVFSQTVYFVCLCCATLNNLCELRHVVKYVK